MNGVPTTLEALRQLSAADAERLGTSHTLGEILQQPRLWKETARLIEERRAELADFFGKAGMFDLTAPQVVLIGAGSSDYVAQLVAPAFRARFGVTTQALPSTDLLTQLSTLLCARQRYLFVWFSRSGTTPEALELLPLLERAFADSSHLIVTCNATGELARRALAAARLSLVLPDAANDRGLAMTSSFTCMALAGLLSVGSEGNVRKVADLSAVAERILAGTAVSELARSNHRSACFLGSGALRAAAGECSLKLTELSAGYVSTRCESFLGLRHGPLASVNRDTLLVGLLSSEPEERLYELELIREVREKSLAGTIALVTPEYDARAEQLGDVVVDLGLSAPLSAALRPLLDVTVGQVIALLSSLKCGVRPDFPSENGAIARVVQGIRPRGAAAGG